MSDDKIPEFNLDMLMGEGATLIKRKARIAWPPGGAENVWVNHFGHEDIAWIENDPEDGRYRFGDVVRIENWHVTELLFRPYPVRIHFFWAFDQSEFGDLTNRKKMFDALKSCGEKMYDTNVAFVVPGFGFVELRHESMVDKLVDEFSKLEKALGLQRVEWNNETRRFDITQTLWTRSERPEA